MDSSNPLGSILGPDRKAMEEERLARQAARKKRERSISPPARNSRKAPKRIEAPSESVVDEACMRPSALSSIIRRDQQSRKPANASAVVERMKNVSSPMGNGTLSEAQAKSDSLPQGALKYPDGVVKKTWAFGHPRTGHDIKLEEVLEPTSVRIAVLSAFQWDDNWVLSKLKTPLNGGTTKVIFVMQVKEPEERAQLLQDAEKSSSFLRICLPSMNGLINCMHSKLMLLFHRDKLRVAVPTANLLNFDWGETGQMENSVFLIDLPRLSRESRQAVEDLTFFGKELMFFIEQQGLDQNVRDGVLNFDFTATRDMAFVHTVGGVHWQKQALRTGLLGLGHAVRELGLSATDDLELDFAASSIGSLNEKYLQDFYSAARGVDSVQQAKDAKAKAAANFFKRPDKKSSSGTRSQALQNLRVHFPTRETVRASTAGASGTICLARKSYEAKTFPKEVFRDYKSTREGLLSHNKILCARNRDVAWLYVGSANMSKSAWGELAADRTESKIICRNWECGVLLPVVKPAAGQKETSRGEEGHEDSETEDEEAAHEKSASPSGVLEMDVFKGVIDLPFQVPGDEYSGREPWYFKEQ